VCAGRGRQCNCESECKCRFERNTEYKSETLGFVGLYWVELSVCIIPSIIYNPLPPWTYPVLGNHVNLLVCFYLCLLSVQYAQQLNSYMFFIVVLSYICILNVIIIEFVKIQL
jgi:hypothetical protein